MCSRKINVISNHNAILVNLIIKADTKKEKPKVHMNQLKFIDSNNKIMLNENLYRIF